MIKINLIAEGRRPVVARKAKEALGVGETTLAEWLFLGSVAVLALVILGYWYYLNREISQRKADIAVAQQEVEELAPIIREVENYKRRKARLEHQIRVINNLKQNQRVPVKIMDLLSRALPDLTWLTSMRLRGNAIDLNGQAFNTNQVATFLENIYRVPEFREPFLRDVRKARGGVYNFVLTFRFSWVAPQQKKKEEAARPAAGG